MSANLEVTVVHSAEALSEHAEALECLSQVASEPNVFYEPWMIFPALRTQAHAKLSLVLIWGPDPVRKNAPRVLYGFLPLEEQRNLYRLPVRHYMAWKHNYCSLCTPLVRREFERDTLNALFEWLETHEGRPSLLHFKYVTAEGPVYQAMIDVMNQRARAYCVWEVFNRALFQPRENAEQYLATALSGVRRKEFRRLLRGLGAHGEISFFEPASQEDFARAQREFLEIEASGWKGRNGTALASTPADRQFFEEFTSQGFERGKVQFVTLRAGERPIAVGCDLFSGEGSFAFKIGFDEEFAKFSPGVQLEIENVRRLHEQKVRWMDSCARPVHFMINRLWLDRRLVQSLIVSTGSLSGDLLIPSAPWLKFMKARFVDSRKDSD